MIFMGMDYQYAGSASYDRFGQEVDLVAKMFGGVSQQLAKY